jgi:hypothetical protein
MTKPSFVCIVPLFKLQHMTVTLLEDVSQTVWLLGIVPFQLADGNCPLDELVGGS